MDDGFRVAPLFFGRLSCWRAIDRLSEAVLKGIESVALVRLDL
jgi:hypothetical protein